MSGSVKVKLFAPIGLFIGEVMLDKYYEGWVLRNQEKTSNPQTPVLEEASGYEIRFYQDRYRVKLDHGTISENAPQCENGDQTIVYDVSFLGGEPKFET